MITSANPKSLGAVAGKTKHRPLVTKVNRRDIGPRLTLVLFTRAGGRCELCNKDVTEHELTKRPGNYAEKAHIVAFSVKGPRGSDGQRPNDINALENLMLLCPGCHDEVDGNEDDHSRAQLVAQKGEHEARVHHLLDLPVPNRSHAIVFTSPVGALEVAIPKGDAFHAMLPRYPIDRAWTLIDLTGNRGQPETASFLEIAKARIDREIRAAFGAGGPIERAEHISLFAFGPIPLLVYLGARLSDKVPTDVFQRHRDTETWTWKPETDFSPIKYVTRPITKATPSAPAALVISLSGTIKLETLPSEIRTTHAIYEMTLDGVTPNPAFLKCRRDADAFRVAYHQAQAMIVEHHGDVHPISLFPATPAPIAVLLGRERLRKVRPPLRVFDNDRSKGGFTEQLEIS